MATPPRIHNSCVPIEGAVVTEGCFSFETCYSIKAGDPDWNQTLYGHDKGICDCYSFWTWGTWPNCSQISNGTPITFLLLGVLPFVTWSCVFVYGLITLHELRKAQQLKFNVIVRGICFNTASAFAGLSWSLATNLHIIAPLVDPHELYIVEIFNVACGIFAVVILPTILVLPISWIENIKAAKKLSKKANFNGGQIFIRVISLLFSAVIAVLQGFNYYRYSNIATVVFLICITILFHFGATKIISCAGNALGVHQQIAMTRASHELKVLVFFYVIFAGGYTKLTNKREYGKGNRYPLSFTYPKLTVTSHVVFLFSTIFQKAKSGCHQFALRAAKSASAASSCRSSAISASSAVSG